MLSQESIERESASNEKNILLFRHNLEILDGPFMSFKRDGFLRLIRRWIFGDRTIAMGVQFSIVRL
ncbi:hypothetical protein LptCag_0722 [Leptospirillum ferriphilum]|uniref:Uncharacterized protein n=1 Tax=Leptospirillum ferriphilum TaxID=178606 RepID=A0A094YLL3_9BACT|nr:hypothetical protein LptCag_0722 [Leptospirillum ferriphilum]